MTLKILVVDDASFTRDLIKRTIRKRFPACTVEEAINGRKAQQMLGKIQFDMVLCDWEMPEMTGVELLQWCREQSQYAKETLPFVMITSRGDKSHVVEAVKSGVTDYLGKPFSPDQLIQKVLSAAKKHGMEASLGQAPNTNKTSGSIGADSLSILTSGSKKVVTKDPIIQPEVSSKDVKIPSLVRFAGKEFRCMVVHFAKQEATMLIKSDDVIPTVLDQAVLDLSHDGKVNRLNYYVQAIATTEKKPDSAFLTVTLALIDQDEEKESFIATLFDSL